MKPQVLILRTAGSNCDEETAHAFQLAGAEARRIHLNRVLENPKLLKDFQIMAIPGGFSYGDDISSGKIFANRIRIHLAEALAEFVAGGKPIIGICNGFQVLVKAGLLPGPASAPPAATLAHNDSHRFIDRWIHLLARSKKCIWTRDLAGVDKGENHGGRSLPSGEAASTATISLPVAHGEGKFIAADDQARRALWDHDQVVFVYTRRDGSPAGGEFPENPNGSINDIAGICDSTGLILGLMPHPERYVNPQQHPAWTSQNPLPDQGDGLQIFRSAVTYAAAQW